MSEPSVIELPVQSEPTTHDRITDTAGTLNVVYARLTDEMAELLACDGWQIGGKRTPTEYLIWKAGLSPHTAGLVVRVAERRGDYPNITALLDQGQLSLDQCAAAMQAPAWADDSDWTHFIRISTVPKIQRALRSDMFAGDPDDPDTDPRVPRDKVSFGVRRDGRWRLNANLNIDDGRRVEAALNERRDGLFEGADDDSAKVGWADALVDMAERSLDAVESQSRRDRHRTWIHLDVTDGTATTTDGWHIPMALADRITCDGVVQPVWESEGVPFSVGRAQHIVPLRTRRIIERRDRGCRVPGCTASRFVEIHHIVHWLDGGPTDTCNLIALCSRHHKLHHLGQLGISGNADDFDGITFTDAEGRVVAGRAQPVTPTGPPPTPTETYRTPLNGRFDWSWLSGWEHPNATRQRVAANRARLACEHTTAA